jgi:hypothetical protein
MRAIHCCQWLNFVIACLSANNRESRAEINTRGFDVGTAERDVSIHAGGASKVPPPRGLRRSRSVCQFRPLFLSIFNLIERMEVYDRRFGPEYSWAESTNSSDADCEVLSGRVLVPFGGRSTVQ